MKPLVTDELWERVQPLLPPPRQRRFRFPGRKPLDYRKILTGILFVLKTGIAWDDLPAELGCGCGKTCRHYLRVWHQGQITSEITLISRAMHASWGNHRRCLNSTDRPSVSFTTPCKPQAVVFGGVTILAPIPSSARTTSATSSTANPNRVDASTGLASSGSG